VRIAEKSILEGIDGRKVFVEAELDSGGDES